MANDVRKRMIEGALSLLSRRGLQGASFSEILAATGAPRGSLYHHFPAGKDELIAASVDEASRILIDALQGARNASAESVVARFLAIWRIVLERGDCQAGCAVLAVAVGGATPDLVSRAAAAFNTWRDLLSGLLEDGGLSGAEARRFSVTLIAAVEGAVALSRTEQTMEPFEIVAAHLIDQVRILAEPKNRRPSSSAE